MVGSPSERLYCRSLADFASYEHLNDGAVVPLAYAASVVSLRVVFALGAPSALPSSTALPAYASLKHSAVQLRA